MDAQITVTMLTDERSHCCEKILDSTRNQTTKNFTFHIIIDNVSEILPKNHE
jgi:hypothetical protein